MAFSTAIYEYKAIICSLIKAFEFLPSLSGKEVALYPSALNAYQPFVVGTRGNGGKVVVPVRVRCLQDDM